MRFKNIVNLEAYREARHRHSDTMPAAAVNDDTANTINRSDRKATARTDTMREYIFELRELAIRMEAIMKMDDAAKRVLP